MGYQTKTQAQTGFSYYLCAFEPVDGNVDGIDIQDIVPSAAGGNIQFLDSSQGCANYYYWYKASGGSAGPKGAKFATDRAGLWFEQIYDWSTGKKTSEAVAVRRIKSGDSFQFSASAGIVLTFSGSVPAKSATFTSTATGFNYWGNPFPAEVDIQDFVPSVAGGNIQFLDASQGCVEYYYWYKASGGSAGPKGAKVATDRDGLWFLQTYDWSTGKKTAETLAVRMVQPGEGFQFSAPSVGMTVQVKKPYSL